MIKLTSKSRAIKPALEILQIECTAETFKISKTSNFLSSFKFNYYFLRVFGQWPFALVRDSNGEIQKHKIRILDPLWFIISMALYIAASITFYKNAQFERENPKFARKIINSGEYIRITLSLIFVALEIAIDMCNRRKLINVVNMFLRFDESVSVDRYLAICFFDERHSLNTKNLLLHIQVSSWGIDFDYKREYLRSLIHCVAQIIATILVEVLYHIVVIISKPHLCKVLLNHFIFALVLYSALTAISTSFVALLLNLKRRYAALNTHLRLMRNFKLHFEFECIESNYFF